MSEGLAPVVTRFARTGSAAAGGDRGRGSGSRRAAGLVYFALC